MVQFVLTGIKPLTPIYSYNIKYHGRIVNLAIYRPISKGLLDELYLQIKGIFKKKGKQFLTQKQRDLYFLVEKFGGPPKTSKMKFWKRVKEKWNETHRNKYSDWKCVRVAYMRILKHIQSDELISKSFDGQITLDKPKIKLIQKTNGKNIKNS